MFKTNFPDYKLAVFAVHRRMKYFLCQESWKRKQKKNV